MIYYGHALTLTPNLYGLTQQRLISHKSLNNGGFK